MNGLSRTTNLDGLSRTTNLEGLSRTSNIDPQQAGRLLVGNELGIFGLTKKSRERIANRREARAIRKADELAQKLEAKQMRIETRVGGRVAVAERGGGLASIAKDIGKIFVRTKGGDQAFDNGRNDFPAIPFTPEPVKSPILKIAGVPPLLELGLLGAAAFFILPPLLDRGKKGKKRK